MLQLSQKHPKKRAFITGTASGFGKELSLLLAQDGWTIGMCDLHRDTMEETAAEVHRRGGKALLFDLDVSDKETYEIVANDFLSQTGGIDLLINNAGVGDGGPFHEYSLADWDWLLGINLMGVLYGCHYFVTAFRTQQSGHIINIASAAGFVNGPNMAAYNMSKAGVISLSETLSYELQEVNVQVSVVMPTFIQTNIMQFSRNQDPANKAMVKELMEKSPMTAKDSALKMLEDAGKGKFHIMFPRDSHIMYQLKRFMPKYFKKQVMKMLSKVNPAEAQEAKVEATA